VQEDEHLCTQKRKQHAVKHGHVTGRKKERRPSNFYYESEECAALLAQLDADEAVKAAQTSRKTPTTEDDPWTTP
jgi:hypothetical protein